MKTPLCPHCGEELVIVMNADVKYFFNKKTEKYDVCEIDSHTGDMCNNCSENPWGVWEEDETTDIFETMQRITPSYKFMIVGVKQ